MRDRIGGPRTKYWNRRSDPEMHRAQQELDHSLTVAALIGRTHPAGSVTDPWESDPILTHVYHQYVGGHCIEDIANL